MADKFDKLKKLGIGFERPPYNLVNHPSHYRAGDVYETIRVIEAWNLNFNLGNTIKYISRVDAKGDPIENLEKARWYLTREIDNLKKASTENNRDNSQSSEDEV